MSGDAGWKAVELPGGGEKCFVSLNGKYCSVYVFRLARLFWYRLHRLRPAFGDLHETGEEQGGKALPARTAEAVNKKLCDLSY